MNKIFNFKGREVRTVTIDNEPYFVGKGQLYFSEKLLG